MGYRMGLNDMHSQRDPRSGRLMFKGELHAIHTDKPRALDVTDAEGEVGV